MNRFRLIAILLTISLFGAVLLMGKGITGMATLSDDPFMKPICSFNTDCRADEVCCLFHNSDAGVCNYAESCEGITTLTKAEQNGEQIDAVELNTIDTNKDNVAELAFGTALFITTALLFSYYISRERKTVKSRY